MTRYDEILALLKDVPWKAAPEVYPIAPVGHKRLGFFPGQRGFCGETFPVGGMMFVANNFSNLAFWEEYKADLDYCEESQTWQNLNSFILPAARDVTPEECWFTNYNLGVMNKPKQQYTFRSTIQEALGFAAFFEATVAKMEPRAIVVIGEHAADSIGIQYVHQKKRQERVHQRRFGEVDIPVLSIIHPSAHAKRSLFQREGERIGQASKITMRAAL
jgi:hypothetical protein